MDETNPGGLQSPRLFWGTIFAAAALAGMVVALIFLVREAGRDRDEALKWQERSLQVIDLTRSADASIARAEAAMGRFAVSLDKTDGRQHVHEWRLADKYLQRLETIVRDDPQERALIARLRELFDRRAKELDIAGRSANYRMGLAALSRFYAASRGPDVGEIRRILDEMVKLERQQLALRSYAVNRSASDYNRLISLFSITGAGLALGLGGLLFLAMRLDSQRKRARELAESEAERTTLLEEAVARRTEELRQTNMKLVEEANERAQAESRLRQAQKMEALGQITGGIAHDFNNMLAVVVSGIELGNRRMETDTSRARDHLDNALEGARRASVLTQQLLTFAREQPLTPEAVDPTDTLHTFRHLIDRSIGDQIALRISEEPCAWRIWVDQHQLENALLNLAVNGRDAMEGRGELTIESLCTTFDTGPTANLRPGDYVEIRVTDTGSGIAPEVMDRIFDPFFTTKGIGEGTGLGMSQVFGFARQSGGDVRIESAVGRGTTVTLLLPRFTGKVRNLNAGPARAAAADAPVPAAAMTVLVVEDDTRVRFATCDALRELGHTPVSCEDPRDAIRLLAETPNVALIVSDVLMPHMTGPELIRTIKPAHPDIAVLFVTGFSGEGDDADYFGGMPVLRKPYTLVGLERAIQRALESHHVAVEGAVAVNA